MPPEDELADEVPLRDENDSAEPEAEASPNPSDSGVDFAVGDAPDDDPVYDYDGPTEDLTGELADDAGAEASYGYDTAAETARFNDRAELTGLSDNAALPDDSQQYKLSQSDPGESSAAFAEEAGVVAASDEAAYAPADEAAYEPAPVAEDDGGYASHHPDMVDAGPVTSDDEMGPAGGFTVEEEPAPEPEPEPARPAARPPAPPKPSRPEPEVDASGKPGQVRKSAIDEMFARAAELKRQKGR